MNIFPKVAMEARDNITNERRNIKISAHKNLDEGAEEELKERREKYLYIID